MKQNLMFVSAGYKIDKDGNPYKPSRHEIREMNKPPPGPPPEPKITETIVPLNLAQEPVQDTLPYSKNFLNIKKSFERMKAGFERDEDLTEIEEQKILK